MGETVPCIAGLCLLKVNCVLKSMWQSQNAPILSQMTLRGGAIPAEHQSSHSFGFKKEDVKIPREDLTALSPRTVTSKPGPKPHISWPWFGFYQCSIARCFLFKNFLDSITSTVSWNKPTLHIWRFCFNFPICKPLSCVGRQRGRSDQLSHGQKPEGLSALGCFESSEWEVRMLDFPHGGCANILSLRLPRPGNLTPWFREFRQKSPSSSFFGCIYMVILMEANGWVEECLIRCNCDHSSRLRNSLQQMLCWVRRGQMWSGSSSAWRSAGTYR